VARLHVLRVFCDEAGEWGNPLGVFLDGAAVPGQRRQAVARELGFSETVFVDDAERGAIRIFTPGLELPFAGHPSVGAAWLLARVAGDGQLSTEPARQVRCLRPPAGEVQVRGDEELTYITARPEWSPPWELIELGDAAEVEALEGPPAGRTDEIYLWAWLDERAGTVRSRCYSLADGVGEDEATGSAAIMLAAALGREVEIHQGEGSRLYARPLGEGWAEVGGRVVLDELREFAV
jgi:predicted PhzF superfamily epimerase YddE/YHI9